MAQVFYSSVLPSFSTNICKLSSASCQNEIGSGILFSKSTASFYRSLSTNSKTSSSYSAPVKRKKEVNFVKASLKASSPGSTSLTQTLESTEFSVPLWTYTPEAEGDLETPAWTGDDPISKLVNTIISFKPLFALLKLGARQIVINTAEKAGIPWMQRLEDLRANPLVYSEKERLENKDIVYPSYYTQEFHAYSKGNLCWEAAFEVEQATGSMCRRAIPWAANHREAAAVLRGGWLRAIREHHVAHSGGLPVTAVLDVGCSVGISTDWLAGAFGDADITGLDLSPYFLAVASVREREREEREGRPRDRPITWLHALGEDTGLSDASFDVVSLAYVIHECPEHATSSLVREARRLLRVGGTIAITDNSPKSKVIQNLPGPVFTLMKSTEPWSDQYFGMDLEGILREAGFGDVTSVLTDPRHRTVTATAV